MAASRAQTQDATRRKDETKRKADEEAAAQALKKARDDADARARKLAEELAAKASQEAKEMKKALEAANREKEEALQKAELERQQRLKGEQEREELQAKQKRTEEDLAQAARDLQSLQINPGAEQVVVQNDTQEAQQEEDDPNNSLGHQVNSQAQSYIKEHFRHHGLVNPGLIVVDPINRNGQGIMSSRVHQLIDEIATVGFDLTKCSTGVVVVIGSNPDQYQKILSFNKDLHRVAQGLLAPVDPEVTVGDYRPMRPVYSALGCNHLIQALRAFAAGIRTTSEVMRKHKLVDGKGRLSLQMLKAAHPAFAEAVEMGIPMTILDESVRRNPMAMNTIQKSLNITLVQAGTEVQLMAEARALFERVDSGGLKEGAVIGLLEQDWGHLKEYLHPVAQFVKALRSGPFLADLLCFCQAMVDSELRFMPSFWQCVAEVPSGLGWASVSLMKTNWTSKGPDKDSNNMCRLVTNVRALMKPHRTPNVRQLHETLATFRVTHREVLAKLSYDDRIFVLASLDTWAGKFFISTNGKTEVTSWLSMGTRMDLKLVLSSFQDVALVAHARMEATPSFRNLGIKPTHGDPSLSGVKRSQHLNKGPNPVTGSDYSPDGTFIGQARVLMKAGIMAGTEFILQNSVVTSSGTTIPGFVTCAVESIDQDFVRFKPRRQKAITMKVVEFPHKDARIVYQGKGTPAKFWSFQDGNGKNTDWVGKVCKQAMFESLLFAAHERFADQVACEAEPEKFFRVQLEPFKGVFAAKDMKVVPEDKKDRIMMVPVSPRFMWRKAQDKISAGSIRTSVTHTTSTHEEEVLCIQPFLKMGAAEGDTPYVNPCWCLRLAREQEGRLKPNLKVQMMPASIFADVKVPPDVLPSYVSKALPEMEVPVLVLTRDLQEDDELILLETEMAEKEVMDGRSVKAFY